MTSVLMLLVSGGRVRTAQQQQPPPAERPEVTFRVDVNYVEIDAVVTDRQGKFVSGLTAADFELVEDGQPQTISAFTMVDVPIRHADPPLLRSTPIEPDVRSNRAPFDGRVFLIVLDDLQAGFDRTPMVQAAAKQFVRRFVAANDLAAVVHTSGGGSGAQNFTSSQSRLLAAIDTFKGRKVSRASGGGSVFDRTGRTGDAGSNLENLHHAVNSVRALGAAAEFLGTIHGRRKAVVWFSEGVDYDIENAVASPRAVEVLDEMRDAIAAATRSGVSFYGIDARGVGAGLDAMIGLGPMDRAFQPEEGMAKVTTEIRRAQNFLRTMSTETGGFPVVNQNDLNGAFAKIVEANSRYYLLGYHPANTARDGKFRKVQVRAKRQDLQVRARAGYTAPEGKAPRAPRNAGDNTGASREVRAALDSPLPVTGLGFRVVAAPFAGPGGKAAVAVVVEFDPARLSFARQGGIHSEDIELVILPVDGSGKAHRGGRDVAPLRLSQATYDRVRVDGLRLAHRLDLPPGRYQLHVAARAGNSGAVGAVIYDLDVPDFRKPPLVIGGLALMSAASRIPTPRPTRQFLDVLPEVPTALREFRRSDTLSVRTEIHGNGRSPAHRVAIRTSVTDETGRVVFSAADERGSDDIDSPSSGFRHAVEIPLASVAPGRYVVSVNAQRLLPKGSTASREVEIQIR